MSWHVSPWVYPIWDSLGLLDLIDHFLFLIGEILNYNLFKNFLILFIFPFFFWDHYNSNVGAFDIILKVSLFHIGEIFNYNLFKNFLIPFNFLFFFWDPYTLNVGSFDIASEVSETILSYFHYFYIILLFRSYFHHFIFQLTDSFFCFRYSAIDYF